MIGIDHLGLACRDVEATRAFYINVLRAEPLQGSHSPVRVGSVVLAFFPTNDDAQARGTEIAFSADRAEFEWIYEASKSEGLVRREPVDHTPFSKGFSLVDPDGREIEVAYVDPGVYWRE